VQGRELVGEFVEHEPDPDREERHQEGDESEGGLNSATQQVEPGNRERDRDREPGDDEVDPFAAGYSFEHLAIP